MSYTVDADMNPQALRSFVQEFRQALIKRRRSDFDLGRFLYNIRTHALWRRWPRRDQAQKGYHSWSEFCDREIGYKTRSADTLVINYQRLTTMGLDENGDTFARCMRLGWSKLAWVLRVAATEDNLIRWLDYIEDEELSELQLRAKIAEAKRRQQEQQQPDGASGSSMDGEPGEPDESQTPQSEMVPYTVKFPDQESVDTFTFAVEAIRRRYGEDVSMGKCVGMMATHYLASHPRDDEGGAAVEVENLIRLMESAYGVKLKIDTGKGKRRRSKTVKSMQKRDAES